MKIAKCEIDQKLSDHSLLHACDTSGSTVLRLASGDFSLYAHFEHAVSWRISLDHYHGRMTHHNILLRHGDTEINAWNTQCTEEAQKRIGGQRESPLIDKGILAATNAGKQIAGMGYELKRLMHGDHGRTVHTTELVLAELPNKESIQVVSTPALREINYGDFAGKTVAQVRETHPEYFSSPELLHWRGDFRARAPGGENYEDIQTRLRQAQVFESLSQPSTTIIVSSLHTIRVLLHEILGLSEEDVLRLSIPNAVPLVLERGEVTRLIGDRELTDLLKPHSSGNL